MPHACRPCFVPYGLRFKEIFGASWSRPGRSVRAGPIRCPLKENSWKFQVFPTKSRSLASPRTLALAERPHIGKNHTQTYIAVATVRRSSELKPGNRRFSPKSPKMSLPGRLMGPALIDRPGIGKNLLHKYFENLFLVVFAWPCKIRKNRAARV